MNALAPLTPMADARLQAIISVVDRTKPGISSATANLRSLNSQMRLITMALGGFGVGRLGGAFLKMATDAESTRARFSKVFGSLAAENKAWIDVSVKSTGQSKLALMQHLTALQLNFQGMGIVGKGASDLSRGIIAVSADISAFNNVGMSEVLQGVVESLSGSGDSVRKYGINVTKARIEQEIINNRWARSIEAATSLQKAQATLNIITRELGPVAGSAAEKAGTLAGKWAELKTRSVELVVALSPLLVMVKLIIEGFLEFISMTTGIANAIKSVNEALKDIPGVTAFMDLLRTSLETVNKLAGVLLGFKMPPLRDILLSSLGSLPGDLERVAVASLGVWTGFGKQLSDAFKGMGKAMADFFMSIPGWVASTGGAIAGFFKSIPSWIADTMGAIGKWIASLPGVGAGILKAIWSGIVSGALEFIDRVKAVPGWVKGALEGVFGDAVSIGKSIVTGLWEGIQGLAAWIWDKVWGFANRIFDAFRSGLGKLWPFSPSKAGIDIGRGLVEGIRQGISLASVRASGLTLQNAVMATPSTSMSAKPTSITATRSVANPIIVRVVLDSRVVAEAQGRLAQDEEQMRSS